MKFQDERRRKRDEQQTTNKHPIVFMYKSINIFYMKVQNEREKKRDVMIDCVWNYCLGR